MTETFHRDRCTWLAYLLLAFYGYFLNSLGPITPFLKDELRLSYTVSSLHFTAFAAGILLVGLVGQVLIPRVGQESALWIGAFGISVSAAVLIFVRSVFFTVGASFFMGSFGSLILVTVPSILSDRHGGSRPVALSEANLTASLVSIAAPLLVGWAAHLPGGWRWALGIVALAPFLARPWFGRFTPCRAVSPALDSSPGRRALPGLYWLLWAALFLAVSVEFCMIFWSASYLTTRLGVSKATAAQAVALFLGGMVVGRLAGSRLVRHFPIARLLIASVVLAGLGFGLFWGPRNIGVVLVGLLVTGLGVASLYPLVLSLAIGVTQDSVRASVRATLASGGAILALPLVLGRLADAVGIWAAYGVVVVLLAGILAVLVVAAARVRQPGPPQTEPA